MRCIGCAFCHLSLGRELACLNIILYYMSIDLINQYGQDLLPLYAAYDASYNAYTNLIRNVPANFTTATSKALTSHQAYTALITPLVYQGSGNDAPPNFNWIWDIWPGETSKTFSSYTDLFEYANDRHFFSPTKYNFIAITKTGRTPNVYYVAFGTAAPTERIIPKEDTSAYNSAIYPVGGVTNNIIGGYKCCETTSIETGSVSMRNHTYGGVTGCTWAIYPIITVAVLNTASAIADTDSDVVTTIGTDFMAIKTAQKTALDELYGRIVQKIMALNSLVEKIAPKGTSNRAAIDANYANLLTQYHEMTKQYEELNTELNNKTDLLKGNYEVAQLSTTTNFLTYILYIFFAIFIIGCLIYVYMFPEAGNLDMFILALAVIILVYYIYEIILEKYRKKIVL